MPGKVLIADDEPIIQETLSDVLGDDFDCLLHAWDGVEAVETAEREVPDLVLLDLDMPRMDGIAACQEIRSAASLRHVPVVILTACTSSRDAARAFEAGADDLLTKPFAPSMLRTRLRTWMLRQATV